MKSFLLAFALTRKHLNWMRLRIKYADGLDYFVFAVLAALLAFALVGCAIGQTGFLTGDPRCEAGWFHTVPNWYQASQGGTLAVAWCLEAPVTLAQIPNRINEMCCGFVPSQQQAAKKLRDQESSLPKTGLDSEFGSARPVQSIDSGFQEPIDVPAIQEDGDCFGWDTASDPKHTGLWISSCVGHYKVWTCPLPKDRVLLQSEDGKRHCVKF